jgi:hypothetical protein
MEVGGATETASRSGGDGRHDFRDAWQRIEHITIATLP